MKTLQAKVYIFNNIDTGEVWSVKSDSFRNAVDNLPEDADWNDWFTVCS